MKGLPLVFHWPYLAIFSAVYAWVFWPEAAVVRRSGMKTANNDQDRGTMRWLLAGNQSALLLGFLASVYFFPFRISNAQAAFRIGILLMVSGSLVRRHCFKMLGNSFTGRVIVREGQMVVERGLYRWIRHPSYLGGIIMFSGIGAALGDWISLGILVLLPLPFFLLRITVEEQALVATIGKPYLDYMARTKRIVPFVY
ncbi:isoprenylcysteine carboxylmethyltransferase family protein [Candidatus Sumerlaeota bacterium]|nr:isoprenylcysteine carboxylmethyltransferase family protein [Candidatus Sumerlaeota bacterium]